MTEDYLHYIWKFLKFNTQGLISTDGEEVQIIKPGSHNYDAGPDFSEAQIVIDNVKWIGSVEIHIQSSDWNKHKHQYDDAYNNVILHVVYENDGQILNAKGDLIPTLELKSIINEGAYFRYEQLLNQGTKLPCESSIKDVPNFIITGTLDEMLISRLQRKSEDILISLEQNNSDWEETFHQFLFKYMGMRVNGEAMSELAKRVSSRLLHKTSSQIEISEAILFGQAGLLKDEDGDEYYKKLRAEYLYQKQKYNLVGMNRENWRFSKMRPPNFPTLRIAQLAGIYSAYQHLFHLIRDKVVLKDLFLLFDSTVSEYWKEHYSFTTKSTKHQGRMGKTIVENLVINLIVPFAFTYGRSIGDASYETYALSLLDELKLEVNKISKLFIDLNFRLESARDSQSCLQLYNEYCSKKKCLNCKIGVYLMQ